MTTSALFKLDNDTFLSIFDTITSQIPDRHTLRNARPLAIVRAASQVCQQWRELLLASPWIWGRLVDLDVESNIHVPQSVQWLEEVVRRTESVPLWIYGRIENSAINPTAKFNIESFFIRLLDSWERIEILSVFIESDHKETASHIQNRFLCRAPILKFFDVHFPRGYNPLFLDILQPGSSQSLFEDYAPSLRAIKADQVAYKLDSPWLSRIREICPLPPNLACLQDIFILLQHTPMIEKIVLHAKNRAWPDRHQTHSSFPRLVLPNLSSITLWCDLSAFAALLDRISPGQISTLVVRMWDYKTTLDNSLIPSSLKANLPFYISSYITTNIVTCFQLSMGHRHFRLCDASNVSDDDSIVNLDVMIYANLVSYQHDWDIIPASLFEAFTETLLKNPSVLRTVTKLRLPRLEAHSTLIPKVSSFLAVFRHVQHIQTDESSLSTLYSLEEASEGAQDILFPECHTLCLTSLNSKKSCANLTAFVMTRIKIGYPIAKLDLMHCITTPRYGDALCGLDAAHGLEVFWKKWWERNGDEDPETCIHICGTGNTGRLKDLI